ncbi:MAG: Ig-like domain-containing protein [Holophagaceae bacterium]|nr:Ig-like domain-containing protein [Holophagaceae bacterium]
MTSLRSVLHAWRRPLLPFALGPLALTLACSSNITLTEPGNAAGDPASTTSPNFANFDPSAGVIPLPNLLVTATTTTPIALAPGVPLTPDKALVYINQREVGGTNAVAAVNGPIYISFAQAVDPSTITSATIKVFQAIPDATATENGVLGFRDISALFDKEMVVNNTAVQLFPKIPLLPGNRYLYVVTGGVKDAATHGSVGNSLTFGILRYVKPGGTSANTNLADLTDPNNPARLVGAASAASLEQLRANVVVSGQIALSGFGKTMDDLVTNGAADTSGKAGAGATGITSRNDIKLMSRFITTGAAATRTVLTNAATQVPVETALWAWANNANVAPFAFGPASGARQWSNGATLTTLASGVPAVDGFYASQNLGAVPHNAIGFIGKGSFQSGDLNLDPAIVGATAGKPASADLTGTANVYNPGTSTLPGTGVLQGARPDGASLTGFYHTSRTVPFYFMAPAAAAAPGGYPVVIFQHGIGGQKEQLFAMANAACTAGYAVVAIDLPLHGELGNSRPTAEWSSNFISLPSALNARTNVQQAGFNLWRLERVLLQPTVDPTSLQALALAAGKAISPDPAARRYVGISLGSIVGTYFLAGNSSQTGGSNMKALLSVPGGRIPYLLRDSPTFAPTINAGLAAAGVQVGTPSYHQFMLLLQAVVETIDPAYMTTPIATGAPSRLSGRTVWQEAIGDTVIPNSSTRYFANALGGRGVAGATNDIAPAWTQIRYAAAAAPTVPFLLGPGGLKPSGAPASDPATGPTEGYFQFGSTTTAASHGMLLDGSANTPAVQKQMVYWLLTGRLIDPTDTAHWPIAPVGDVSEAYAAFPSVLGPIYFPKANQ